MKPITRFPGLAYEVLSAEKPRVLCDQHLDLLRSKQKTTLTGKTFGAKACEECAEEKK